MNVFQVGAEGVNYQQVNDEEVKHEEARPKETMETIIVSIGTSSGAKS